MGQDQKIGMPNPVAGLSKEEALKKAESLGDGKDMGTWRTMSGEQFMKWWAASNPGVDGNAAVNGGDTDNPSGTDHGNGPAGKEGHGVIRISAEYKVGRMDGKNKPAAVCNDGDTVIFETEDCSDGAVRPDGSRDRTPGKYIANPATGPLYVNGAEAGDVLEVRIKSLGTGRLGFMGTGSNEKMMGHDVFYPRRVFDISDGKISVGGHIFPVSPMIGVIGVAPAGEGIGTITPDSHGGNMDCTRVKEGAVLYFPVSAPGALLAMGDLHAAMGDGECAMYGLETPGEVTVGVHVIKGKKLRWPVCVCEGVLSVIASAKTTDECCELAIAQLYDILLENGWDSAEALYLMSLKCNLAVCQIVDPNMTVRADLPAEYIRPEK